MYLFVTVTLPTNVGKRTILMTTIYQAPCLLHARVRRLRYLRQLLNYLRFHAVE